MAAFKTKEEYEAEAKNKKYAVTFRVITYEGEIALEQIGTNEELQEALVSIGKNGLTLHNQDGFEWYPQTSIRKVIVKTK